MFCLCKLFYFCKLFDICKRFNIYELSKFNKRRMLKIRGSSIYIFCTKSLSSLNIFLLFEVVLFIWAIREPQYIRITQVLRAPRNIVIILKDNDVQLVQFEAVRLISICTNTLCSLNISILLEVVPFEHMFYLVPQYIRNIHLLRTTRAPC